MNKDERKTVFGDEAGNFPVPGAYVKSSFGLTSTVVVRPKEPLYFSLQKNLCAWKPPQNDCNKSGPLTICRKQLDGWICDLISSYERSAKFRITESF